MITEFDWSKHAIVKQAVRRWLKSQRRVEILPAKSWLAPLNIDILVRRTCPEEIYTFNLHEVKVSRQDLQRAAYQLETCRILLEDRGATRCYVTVPHGLIDELDHCGEYPFFITTMKRFGYGVVTVSPGLIPTVYLGPKTFKRVEKAKWK